MPTPSAVGSSCGRKAVSGPGGTAVRPALLQPGLDGPDRWPTWRSDPVPAPLLGRLSTQVVSTSAFSRRLQLWSSCSCSTTRGPRGPQGSSLWMPTSIAPITTGMSLCRAFSRARFMPTGRTALSRPKRDVGSTARRCSSTLTALPYPSPIHMTARRRARPGDNAAVAMKSVVADPDRYDWEGDRPLRRPLAETVIYELHVRGFTRHPSSGVAPAQAGNIRRPD